MSRDDDGNCICSVCRDPFHLTDLLSATGCGHVFHQSCLVRWMCVSVSSSTSPPRCPICSAPLATVTSQGAATLLRQFQAHTYCIFWTFVAAVFALGLFAGLAITSLHMTKTKASA